MPLGPSNRPQRCAVSKRHASCVLDRPNLVHSVCNMDHAIAIVSPGMHRVPSLKAKR